MSILRDSLGAKMSLIVEEFDGKRGLEMSPLEPNPDGIYWPLPPVVSTVLKLQELPAESESKELNDED